MRRSHGAYFLALAERAGQGGADQRPVSGWKMICTICGPRYGGRCQGAPATAVRLSGSLWRFW
jgi:hypothetical protein